MAIVRSSRIVRVAFLTDSAFDEANSAKRGMLKKRALYALQRKHRLCVVEDSTNPDVVYEVRREFGSKGWKLHHKVY